MTQLDLDLTAVDQPPTLLTTEPVRTEDIISHTPEPVPDERMPSRAPEIHADSHVGGSTIAPPSDVAVMDNALNAVPDGLRSPKAAAPCSDDGGVASTPQPMPNACILANARAPRPGDHIIGASGLASRWLIDKLMDRPTSLAAAFDFIANQMELPGLFRQGVERTRKIMERLTGRTAAELPTVPVDLRPLLRPIRLKAQKIGHKRWNASSVLQSVLILTGWVSPEARQRYKLPKTLEDLLIASDAYGKRRALAGFMRHCHRHGIDLTTGDFDLVGYVDWLAEWTLDQNPWATGLGIKAAWQAMQASHACWPAARLVLPPRRQSRVATRLDLRCEPLVRANFLAPAPS